MHHIQSIITGWTVPGCSFVACDSENTGLFWSLFRSVHGCRVVSFPVHSSDVSAFTAQLSQSFLGQSLVYWMIIPAATQKTAKVRQQVLQFLTTYTGPHTVWAVISPDEVIEGRSVPRIAVPATISAPQLLSLAEMLNMVRSATVIDGLEIVPRRSDLSLDAATLLLVHAGYVPTRNRDEAVTFLRQLLPQDISVSMLAELFFKQEWTAFVHEWARVSSSYSDMFWISFWTEQLWRAYWVCWYMQRGQQTRARSIGYRLPAAVMNGGWRTLDRETLRLQYEKMVLLDAGIKRGLLVSMDDVVSGIIAPARQ